MFCRELLRRPELDAVFIQYSANGCVLSTLDLRDFLLDQGEDASLVHAQSLILTYELNEWGMQPRFHNLCLNERSLRHCILSNDCEVDFMAILNAGLTGVVVSTVTSQQKGSRFQSRWGARLCDQLLPQSKNIGCIWREVNWLISILHRCECEQLSDFSSVYPGSH